MEFGDYIWNHHEKCIQMSTNMPGFDEVFCEIGLWDLRIMRTQKRLFTVIPLHGPRRAKY